MKLAVKLQPVATRPVVRVVASDARVLAIDPGSSGGMGWALMQNQSPMPTLLHSGSISVKLPNSEDRSKLWNALRDLLHQRYVENLPFVEFSEPLPLPFFVAYERVMRHSGVHAAHIYGGQIAIIQAFCVEHHLPWMPVHVGTVKRFLGLKAAGKDKVTAGVDAAHRLGYRSVTDHNEADAVGIALAAIDSWQIGKNVYGS